MLASYSEMKKNVFAVNDILVKYSDSPQPLDSEYKILTDVILKFINVSIIDEVTHTVQDTQKIMTVMETFWQQSPHSSKNSLYIKD